MNKWVLDRKSNIDLDDLSYTLSLRRSKLEWRFSIVAADCEGIAKATEAAQVSKHQYRNLNDLQITFVFTGQGAQWAAMGRELIMTSPCFRKSLSKSESILQDLGASWSLVSELTIEGPESRLHHSFLAQPATTAIQIAIVDTLESLGVRAQAVIGHSSGEIAAAYTAGILSHEAALKVSYHRGLLSKYSDKLRLSRGTMLVVGLSEERTLMQIEQLACADIVVACVNSPVSTTVSGNETNIDRLHYELEQCSIFSRRLNVDMAYHSFHMEEVRSEYQERLKGLDVKVPSNLMTFMSTVTAARKDSHFGPEYWTDNLLSKVRFSETMLNHIFEQQKSKGSLEYSSQHIIVEIGPHTALKSPIRQTLEASFNDYTYTYIPSMIRGSSALKSLLGLIGKLFEYGLPVNLADVHTWTSSKSDVSVIPNLPGYAWDHTRRYWFESRLSRQHRFREHGPHDLLGTRIASSTSIEPRWRHLISVENLPWLQDHKVDDLIIFPGAAYMCMVIEAVRQHFAQSRNARVYKIELRDIRFLRALVISPDSDKTEIQLSLFKPLDIPKVPFSECSEFRIIASSSEGLWNEHCKGIAFVQDQRQSNSNVSSCSTSKLLDCRESTLNTNSVEETKIPKSQDFYSELKANGNFYGSSFSNIKKTRMKGDSRLLARVDVPDIARIMPSEHQKPHLIHPTTLDALMHAAVRLFSIQKGAGSIMPTGIKQLHLFSNKFYLPGDHIYAETMLSTHGLTPAYADIDVFDQSTSVDIVMKISGLQLHRFAHKPNIVTDPVQPRNISHRLIWGVHPSSLTASHLMSARIAPLTMSPTTKIDLLDRAAQAFIEHSLMKLQGRPCGPSRPHLQKLQCWLERHRTQTERSCATERKFEYSDEPLLAQIQQLGVEGQMLSRIGNALAPILVEDIEPLSLMLEDDLLYKFYSHGSSNQCYQYLSEYFKYHHFTDPRINILEIGAGTGSATIAVLKALSGTKGLSRAYQYDFTDISAGSFDKARDLLTDWQSIVSFKKLDISQDPLRQGFQGNSYDLIIASNVIHATKSITDSLANIRSLLKPQGKLALIELTNPQKYLGLIFGTLEGWWLGKLYRNLCLTLVAA